MYIHFQILGELIHIKLSLSNVKHITNLLINE